MTTYYIEIIVLSFIQGVFEFIHVSSSAHLILVSKFSEINISSLQMDVSLHTGSLLAIISYFWKELFGIFKNKKLFLLIFLGSIPLITIGFILHYSGLIYYLRNLEVIAWTTLIFGILLFLSDKQYVKKKLENDLTIKKILIIGLTQTFALIPGVSRSGIVMTTGRFLQFNRLDAAKISFFLSIPALAGASFIGINDIINEGSKVDNLVLLSTLFSFMFSLITIKFLLIFLNKFSLKVFVYYRVFLSFVLLIIAYT